jgi:hypothetical protein
MGDIINPLLKKVGFDHETAIKWNLPIVSAITALDLPNGQYVLLLVHEGIINEHPIIHYYQSFRL